MLLTAPLAAWNRRPLRARRCLCGSTGCTQLHQRVPVFLGSKKEVEAAVGYHRAHDTAAA